MPRLTQSSPDRLIAARWQATVDDHVVAIAWSPDGRLVAAASVSGPIGIYDAATGTPRARLAGHRLGTNALAWHPREPRLASGGQDGYVRIWNVADDGLTAALPSGDPWVGRLGWSPNGQWLAAAAGRRVRLWTRDLSHVRDFTGHQSTVSDVAWNPRGVMLAATGYGGVWLWHPESEEPRARFEWKGSVLVAAWSPDGKFLATGDQDATVHFWYTQSGRDLQMSGYPTKVRELAWDSTSRLLATGGGKEVTVWDCGGRGPAGSRPLVLPAHELPVAALAFQHEQAGLASVAPDGRLVFWRPKAARKLAGVASFSEGLSVVAWSPDDSAVAVGATRGTVAVIPAPTAS